MSAQSLLCGARAAEAQLLARRAAAPDTEGAVLAALAAACGRVVPDDLAAAGRAIAAAAQAHGESFASGAEPAYHDRHHQAEATLCAGWLSAAARRPGLLQPREAGLLVLAMAGHDLLHEGSAGDPPGALEQRSATATQRLAASLPEAERAEIARLILATAQGATPSDLTARMAREADLFGSLTPTLGWRLSHALAEERRAAGVPGADAIATHGGRLALLGVLPAMTPPAVELGLDAIRQIQREALRLAGGASSAAEGAARLDAMPAEEAGWRWDEALAALGLPGLPP
ncbi:hypothetical protein [Falsiroseomonas sp.]|uniref:hypothetical protein n=1 Tax=Falsiroseomonas sp. TaxID=2870721 RepID=UPI0034A20B0C